MPNSEQTNNPEKQSDASDADKSAEEKKDTSNDKKPASVRKLTLIMVGVVLLFFFWYVIADRLTPSTNQARVRGYIVPIAPQVSGVISEINVAINAVVEEGKTLFKIDPEPFEIAVRKAEADLEKAGQDIGAETAGVAAAQASLAKAQATLKRVQVDANRLIAVEDLGVVPQADIDRARVQVEQEQAKVINAEADLQRAKEHLGKKGADNPKIRKALSALEKARLDLNNTSVVAPSFGAITDVRVDAGQYAQAGKPVMTFISTRAVWVEAYMRENNLGNIEAGDEAEIVLDVAPGRVFKGEVVSVGYGVNWGQSNAPGELPKISVSSGWLRDPQRFPVIIRFVGEEAKGLRREGGQADVIVYTGGNFLFNGLGWLQIRLTSLSSYVY
ncbi:MAG: secretion protein [Gammaproteobacteria bacterium SG8_15]|nr:MAG: secretion protein [Gammaproteobacteria bacterium SG8_15]